MNTSATARYRFTSHSRRLTVITIVSVIVLVVFGSLAFQPVVNIGPFVLVIFLLAIAALAVLLIVLFVQYGYIRAGVWIGPGEVRAQFPLEDGSRWRGRRHALLSMRAKSTFTSAKAKKGSDTFLAIDAISACTWKA